METLKANQVAEIELSYKSKIPAKDRTIIQSAENSHRLFLSNWDMNKIEFIEQFKAIFLNSRLQVLAIIDLSTGGTRATVVDVKLLMVAALKLNAYGIIIAHNHPCGGTTPSEADKHITRKIVEAGKLIDIQVLDHIIVTTEGYYSFADEGAI